MEELFFSGQPQMKLHKRALSDLLELMWEELKGVESI